MTLTSIKFIDSIKYSIISLDCFQCRLIARGLISALHLVCHQGASWRDVFIAFELNKLMIDNSGRYKGIYSQLVYQAHSQTVLDRYIAISGALCTDTGDAFTWHDLHWQCVSVLISLTALVTGMDKRVQIWLNITRYQFSAVSSEFKASKLCH